MKIDYLDQNKWIDLARAAKSPDQERDLHALLVSLCRDVEQGRLLLPLSSTTIYETHKINNPERRRHLASVQAALSGGVVFRGRNRRLDAEISDVLADAYGLPREDRAPMWFLSNIFPEAFAESDNPSTGLKISARLLKMMQSDPTAFLVDFLSSEINRAAAVAKLSAGSKRLLERIEARRTAQIGETLAMRRRIYAATLLIEEIDRVLSIAARMGLKFANAAELGSTNARRIARDVATLDVERELALRIEGQSRSLEENDLRDMQAFCAVVPYADIVVAENQFVSLAVQAKLPSKYKTTLTTNIFDLKSAAAD